jgi:guanylate kinase
MSGNLFTVSAPSGAGKTSLVNAALEALPNLRISVSHTTRSMRPGEEDGVNYNFVDENTFVELIKAGDFLEHAQVFGNFYGTSESWVRETLNAGYDVILEIDWQGAEQVRKIIPETVGIFILPPSRDVLRERLTNRGQDEADVIEQRMSEARDEISHFSEADYVIVNDEFQTALDELTAIILTTDLCRKKDFQKHQALIAELLS